jgi:hypothetical protein
MTAVRWLRTCCEISIFHWLNTPSREFLGLEGTSQYKRLLEIEEE